MTLKVHFDGKVLVPDEPVDLPMNCVLEVEVKPPEPSSPKSKPLAKLVALAGRFPVNAAPTDGAAQHDHYLYGLPKEP